ncbi:MAG: FtsX-like permease family protein [Elusimicrobiota bacterium]
MNFELFVACRYLKTKRKGLFTLVTTAIGVLGVAVGVAALLTTLSVMNGFQSDIRKKIVGAQAHLLIFADMKEPRASRLREALARRPEVAAVSPFVLGQAVITAQGRSMGIVLKGIDPALEFKVNDLEKSITAGSWDSLSPLPRGEGRVRSEGTGPKGAASQAAAPGIVLGEELAKNLGVWLGDEVILVSPQGLSSPMGLLPALKRFRVAGTLRTGYYEYDSATAYAFILDAASFLKTPGGASGLQARLGDLSLAERVAQELQRTLGMDATVRSFSQINRTLFAALKLEKHVMSLILALIILVAAFNIASNLILMSSEKLRDIGLLKAMGATAAQIRRIFLWVGLLIGAIGVGLGLLLGLSLCWIIHRYPLVELPPDIYYLSRVPVQVQWTDLAGIAVCGVALSLLAALYPAARAAKADPVEAIRYG